MMEYEQTDTFIIHLTDRIINHLTDLLQLFEKLFFQKKRMNTIYIKK